ncbi:MAG: hypothetical protein QGG55_06090, partial [Verrucomicrobiota bacterium]|nr:hypothetical protein [Verrucomicrobiota bacterium]
LICACLDNIDGLPGFEPPPGRRGLELRRLEALGRSMMDGHAVLGRELMRPWKSANWYAKPSIVAAR